MVRGWLERGVDGFRLDVFNVFLKHPDLPSNPVRPGATAWERQVHLFDRDQPDLPELIGRFRAIVDEAPGRMSVGELFDGTTETAAMLTTDRHLIFDWELLGIKWTGPDVSTVVARRESVFGADRWPTAVLSNHDQPRHASRLAEASGAADRDAVARAAALLLLTVRGTPFLYYGEELGMGDVDIAPSESMDPPASHVGPDFVWWDRSRCRTPMPWTSAPGAGFTTGTPWLRLGDDAATRNVSAQATDEGSVLSFYRRLIALRAATPALQVGTCRIHPATAETVVAYTRETPEQVVLVVLNLGVERVAWTVPGGPERTGWRILLGTARAASRGEPLATGATTDLSPQEGLILEGIG
jgi:alpha-glucosidase